MIPEGFITSLLDRADIVDVVGRYVQLKKSGRNYMCCCPFHKEKTPSFSISPSKQIYKCFGCGKSGNAIGFLMAIENLEFPEAVRKLAGFYGMEVPEDRSPAKRAARERAKSLSDFMQAAADFYTLQLRTTKKAIDYLKAREISGETAARFALGYSPDGWHALKAVFPDERYDEPKLLEVGLVNEKNGRRYDAFRDRIMFPIRNPKGAVIGFGARTMKGDEQPKYLNSPETPIYHKGSELYGLYEGRSDIGEKGRAIVCEGYMDVIQLSQSCLFSLALALASSFFIFCQKVVYRDLVFFELPGEVLHLRKPLFQHGEGFLFFLSGVQRVNAVQRGFNGSGLPGEGNCLFEKPGGDMLPACLAGAFPTLQVGIFLHHIGVKIVLPLRQVCPVADNLLCTQAVVLCQRNKGQMQVGRFLVHVYHRRHDIFPSYPANEEVRRPLEKRLYLLWGFLLKKLRAGGYQRIDKPCAVLAGSAPGLLNPALNEVVIASLRLDDMEVVFAPACVNVGVAGVLFFLSFVMGFQRPCRVALVLLKPQNCVLCHSAPFPIPFLSGVFHRENPAGIISDTIGMEWI